MSPTGVTAIVKDPTGILHRVSPGSYLGKKYGRVAVIKEAEILLVEIHQTETGDWYERPTGLPYSPDD